MKKLLTALAIASLALCTASQAQSVDAKLELATRVVALQQGPELNRLVAELADSAAQEVVQSWTAKLQTTVPKARQQQASDALNAELRTYFDDVSKLINGKVSQVNSTALVPAYMDRFSVEELRQIAAFFESPVIRKFQAAAPELGNIFVKQLVDATRADVAVRMKQFDEAAAKIVGTLPAPKQAPTPPGTAEKSKPANKK